MILKEGFKNTIREEIFPLRIEANSLLCIMRHSDRKKMPLLERNN